MKQAAEEPSGASSGLLRGRTQVWDHLPGGTDRPNSWFNPSLSGNAKGQLRSSGRHGATALIEHEESDECTQGSYGVQ